jgi:hypothetical protein
MSAPDPDSLSLLQKLIAGASAIVLPVLGVKIHLDKRFDRKADKESVSAEFKEVRDELSYQRETQAKIFDQMRQNEQRAQDRHERLMEKLTT